MTTNTTGPLENFLEEKIDHIIRQLPPEERARVHYQNGEFSGPVELIRKIKDLARRDDKKGMGGD